MKINPIYNCQNILIKGYQKCPLSSRHSPESPEPHPRSSMKEGWDKFDENCFTCNVNVRYSVV